METRKLLYMMVLLLVTGCAESASLIKASQNSLRTGVFEEVVAAKPFEKGYADLYLFATVKTHKPGVYSAADLHGSPDYKLLLNIDGQAVFCEGGGVPENREPMKLIDPESGNGIRYRFSKSLRLKAGKHRVVAALPYDGVAIEREVTLTEGGANRLVLEPVYRDAAGKRRPGVPTTCFTQGVRSLSLSLNGREI